MDLHEHLKMARSKIKPLTKEEKSGYVTVKANSRDEAEEKAIDLVNDDGLDDCMDGMEITHRDVQLV